MSAASMTPQEAAGLAYFKRSTGATEIEVAIEAILLYELSCKRVQLTPEQAKSFGEKVEVLSVVSPITKGRLTTFLDTRFHKPTSLRNLAAACEALADNLERFPS